MCTQKASRSNPLSTASCDLSFTFPQQRKRKKIAPKICGEILPSPRDTAQNHIIQEKWNLFSNTSPSSQSQTAAVGCTISLEWTRGEQQLRGSSTDVQHPSPSTLSLLSPVPSMRTREFVLRWHLETPFTMCYQGYRPLARNRASEGLFMPIWFLLSYIRGQGRDRAGSLSSKSILYGTQFSKVQPASAFMKHCAVKNEGSCFSPFKDVW